MKPTDDMENWIEKLQNEEREAREAQERQKAREQDFADFEAKRADREWRLSPEGQRVAELIVAAVEKGEYLPWHEAQVMARQQLAAENAEKKDVAKPSQVEVEEQRVVRDDREGSLKWATSYRRRWRRGWSSENPKRCLPDCRRPAWT